MSNEAVSRRNLLALGAASALTACAAAPGESNMSSKAAASMESAGVTTLAQAPAASLPLSHQMDLRDPVSGHVWRVFVQVPDQPAPTGGYPALYLLDGNATFFAAAQLARNTGNRPPRQRPDPLLVVGIGYATEAAMDLQARRRDYTPPPATQEHSGGADVFLDFIQTQLQPALARTWPVDARRQTLFGHSLGGLLTVHAMLSRPGLFTRHAAASPSLWWNDQHMMRSVSDWLAGDDATAIALQLRVGSRERGSRDEDRQTAARRSERRMNELVETLAARLEERKAPTFVDYKELDGLDHGGTLAPALIDAIALAQREAM